MSDQNILQDKSNIWVTADVLRCCGFKVSDWLSFMMPFFALVIAIEAFMAKYITKLFEYLDNVVGVEINVNKVFYKPEKLRSVEAILDDIASLDKELKELEQSLSL